MEISKDGLRCAQKTAFKRKEKEECGMNVASSQCGSDQLRCNVKTQLSVGWC